MNWTRDGQTRQLLFRDCEHLWIENERCRNCRAKPVPDYKQERSVGRGAVGLNEAQPVITQGTANFTKMNGDPGSKDRFMKGSAHVDRETRKRAAA